MTVYFNEESTGKKIPVDSMNSYQLKMYLIQLIHEKENSKFLTSDPVVNQVIGKLSKRSKIGQTKYNTDLSRKDLTDKDWLNHLQEELLDGANYVQVLLEK
jgi:hypothetical protein